MLQVQETEGAVIFSVKVQPRSSKSMVSGEYDGSVKVNLKAPPVDGAANLECCRLLARTLGVPRTDVQIISGLRGKKKRVKVDGVSLARFREKVAPYL
ncbi:MULTISPECIES: DUF167 domain-containing protein [unclassified Prosthecochloris]|uniref:DUF167 domain-containing protein n=1 Tax=unclassified Prosthecochloris TaxID=2632826 RepID=UPI00223D66F1|nr:MULTISPECIES: DUF167 domain-containing protein [unclassified Prosthecochloris]UZJ38051.1 DUF167 domain-containing protein [Prosthecochloris sp. SCSIO W1103]UZJ41852.1 DUF167 domain-containing protein [Prosthecochloris sp. SCSIO W1101]